MNIEDYLFHTINKDSNDINSIYDNFEKILLCGCLQSNKKRNNDIIKETYNGSDYLKAIKLPPQKMKPLSKQKFLVSNNNKDIRDYYNYLDSISNMYPIDLEVLNKKYKNKIYNKIIDICGIKKGYFNANENAFKKFVIESNGITLMFDKNINYDDTFLIPNLHFEEERKLVKEINNYKDSERYSNLIGEVQVKEELSLFYLKGVIISNGLSHEKIKKLLIKYNYNVKTVVLNNGKLIEI